ncbi:MAG: thiamine phosphate synthase [Candidatus Omnitrophica bacterium]|nr:thiamine phosphate synthase [Candidatus Omnitrophota bacterium]
MRSNKKLLDSVKLYLILDTQVLGYGALLQVLKYSVRGGIDIVQLRDKKGSAKEILNFCSKILKITKGKIPLIVNDRADLAFFSGADGLHVGQEDLDCLHARKMMGHGKIVGVSCQNLAHALKAQDQGADYIGFGPVFQTQTKPGCPEMDLDLLQEVIKRVKIPVFPIGGISRENIRQLIPLGVRRAAICRDILLATDPCQSVRDLKKLLCGG